MLLPLVGLLLAAKPAPQGTLTLTSTAPVTFTAETSHIPHNTGHVWVSTSCFDDLGNRTYYGEEVADANGNYIMDDTVWVLWTPGTVAEGTCRGLLLFRDDRQAFEVILDGSGWFEAP